MAVPYRRAGVFIFADFLACSLCLRAAQGPFGLICSRQPLLWTLATSVTSDSACSESRPGWHHLLDSETYLTCISYLLQFLALLPSSISGKQKSRRLWGEEGKWVGIKVSGSHWILKGSCGVAGPLMHEEEQEDWYVVCTAAQPGDGPNKITSELLSNGKYLKRGRDGESYAPGILLSSSITMLLHLWAFFVVMD